MMNLAGFCRNCLSGGTGKPRTRVEMDDAAAREIVYGMDCRVEAKYQAEATAEQRAYEPLHD